MGEALFMSASSTTWVPAPYPPDLTERALQLADLANLVPPGHWVTYGDLGEAAGLGEAGKSARGVASALSFAPLNLPPDEWSIPWHRIRMENGNIKTREVGEVKDPHNSFNALFTAEGGRLIGASASEGRRYPLAALIRSGRLTP